MPELMDPLNWPDEVPGTPMPVFTRWQQQPSNRLMDVHGDPSRAVLVVFSDGNHHMALVEAVRAFGSAHGLEDRILFLTLPPRILLEILDSQGLQVGNLVLSLSPHVLIGPGPVLDKAVAAGRMVDHAPFMESRGVVLLVARGNPLSIGGIADLRRPGVRLFISNPVREAASFTVYRDTLMGLAERHGLDGAALAEELEKGGGRVIHGESIHHREAPVAVAVGAVDAAVVYYHLALRYTRVFPDRFELVALPGSPGHPQPDATENRRTVYHAGCVDEGGPWGKAFVDFLHSESVAAIYREHGLAPPR
jgi:hypothetical protein